MSRDIASIEADIVMVDEDLTPLMEIRSSLVIELKAAQDALAASEQISDLDLARLSADSRVAAHRLQKIMAGMHPAMRMLAHWMPDPNDYSLGYYAAPNLTLDYKADEAYVTSLAAALIEFAQRFVPTERPEGATQGDLVFADILDHGCGEYASYNLWFEPVEGGRGMLVNRRWGLSSPEPELRPLVDVLREACKTVWYENGPKRPFGLWDGDE